MSKNKDLLQMDSHDFKDRVTLINSTLELAIKDEDFESLERVNLVIKKMIGDGLFSLDNVNNNYSEVSYLYDLIRLSELLIEKHREYLSEEQLSYKKKNRGANKYLKVKKLK